MPGDSYTVQIPSSIIPPPKRISTSSSHVSFELDNAFLDDFPEGLDNPLEVFALLVDQPPLKDKKLVDDLPSRKRRASPFSPFSSGDSFLGGLGDSLLDANDFNHRERARTFNPDALLESLVSFPGDEGDLPQLGEGAVDVHMTDAIPPPLPSSLLPPRIITDDNMMEDEPRLGRYTQAERDARLEQYRAKRRTRSFGKVRYVLRQRVSEQRPRVKGRFIPKNSEPSVVPPFSPMSDIRQQQHQQQALGQPHHQSPSRERVGLVEYEQQPMEIDVVFDSPPSPPPPPPSQSASPASVTKKIADWKRFVPKIFSPMSKGKQADEPAERNRHASCVTRPTETDEPRQRMFSWPMTRPLSPAGGAAPPATPVEWRGFPTAPERRGEPTSPGASSNSDETKQKRSSMTQALLSQFKLTRKSTAG